MRVMGGKTHISFLLCFYCSFMRHTKTEKVYTLQKSDTNIALNRPVKTSAGDSPTVANDGDLNAHWFVKPCVYVVVGSSAFGYWWQVDFGDVRTVDTVLVTNRVDCCPGRIADFSLDVYDTDPAVNLSAEAKHCASYPGPMSSPGITETLHCENSVQGRFLRLSQPKSQLQFCELQAFGTPTGRVLSCGSFNAKPNSRYPAATMDTVGSNIASRAECAAKCGENYSCTGFNIKYSPSVLCELILETISGSPSAGSEFDFYQLDPCWFVCD